MVGLGQGLTQGGQQVSPPHAAGAYTPGDRHALFRGPCGAYAPASWGVNSIPPLKAVVVSNRARRKLKAGVGGEPLPPGGSPVNTDCRLPGPGGRPRRLGCNRLASLRTFSSSLSMAFIARKKDVNPLNPSPAGGPKSAKLRGSGGGAPACLASQLAQTPPGSGSPSCCAGAPRGNIAASAG